MEEAEMRTREEVRTNARAGELLAGSRKDSEEKGRGVSVGEDNEDHLKNQVLRLGSLVVRLEGELAEMKQGRREGERCGQAEAKARRRAELDAQEEAQMRLQLTAELITAGQSADSEKTRCVELERRVREMENEVKRCQNANQLLEEEMRTQAEHEHGLKPLDLEGTVASANTDTVGDQLTEENRSPARPGMNTSGAAFGEMLVRDLDSSRDSVSAIEADAASVGHALAEGNLSDFGNTLTDNDIILHLQDEIRNLARTMEDQRTSLTSAQADTTTRMEEEVREKGRAVVTFAARCGELERRVREMEGEVEDERRTRLQLEAANAKTLQELAAAKAANDELARDRRA
eukprot:3127411-Rhodomonas_salina.1